MSVTPNAILQFASELQRVSTTEIQFRNVVGRAYYAAYHALREFHAALPSQGKAPPGALGMHRELIYRLENPTIAPVGERYERSQRLAIKLNGFHKLRIKADYQVDKTMVQIEARDAVIKATEIFRQLNLPFTN